MALSLRARATTALVLGSAALLGTAGAAFADNAPRSGAKLVAPAAAPVTGYFAVVNANGTFARGKGVVSTQRLNLGDYEVIFNRSIARCAFQASVGNTGFVGTADAGEMTIQGRAGTNNGVFVETHDSTGAEADRPFHVTITC